MPSRLRLDSGFMERVGLPPGNGWQRARLWGLGQGVHCRGEPRECSHLRPLYQTPGEAVPLDQSRGPGCVPQTSGQVHVPLTRQTPEQGQSSVQWGLDTHPPNQALLGGWAAGAFNIWVGTGIGSLVFCLLTLVPCPREEVGVAQRVPEGRKPRFQDQDSRGQRRALPHPCGTSKLPFRECEIYRGGARGGLELGGGTTTSGPLIWLFLPCLNYL